MFANLGAGGPFAALQLTFDGFADHVEARLLPFPCCVQSIP